METNPSKHDIQPQKHESAPAEILIPCSLKSICDPVLLTDDDKANMNSVANELGANVLTNNNASKEEEQTKVLETMIGANEDFNTMMTKPLLMDISEDDDELMWTPQCAKPSCETSIGDLPKRISMSRRSSQRESLEDSTKRNNMGKNNNYAEDFMTESKAAFLDKLLRDNDSSNWKRERGANGDFTDEDFRLRFPWKRIAYIGVLLVLGITCAILALMKVCGGADWMNTATFSVIIMGTVMLLPPGLYYGRILVCISCRCKGYTLWDVPAGPFG